MPGTTARGVPYSTGGDAASTIDNQMQALAQWVNDAPGVAALTTAQRDALAGAARWQGRVIINTDSTRAEWWDGAAWQPLVQPNYWVRFLTMGAVSA